jgi:hypothetical protein
VSGGGTVKGKSRAILITLAAVGITLIGAWLEVRSHGRLWKHQSTAIVLISVLAMGLGIFLAEAVITTRSAALAIAAGVVALVFALSVVGVTLASCAKSSTLGACLGSADWKRGAVLGGIVAEVGILGFSLFRRSHAKAKTPFIIK